MPSAAAFALALLLASDTTGTRTVAVSPGDSVRVEVHHRGPAVVLVAGPAGGTRSFRRVVELLVGDGHQVIVVDPFDPRQAGAGPHTLGSLATRWGGVLDALGVRQAVFVAHSLASSIVLRMVLDRPALARAVISLEGGAVEQVGQAGLRTAGAMAPLVHLPGGGRLVRHRVRGSLRERSRGAAWITDEVVRAYAEPWMTDPGRTVALMRALGAPGGGPTLASRLPEVRIPVLLLLGDVAHASRPPDGEVAAMRAAMPQLQVEQVEGAGHFLHEEQPAAVSRWVSRVGRRGATVAAVDR